MSIYLSGVLLCILINLFGIVATFFGYFSTKSKNFRKINLYYNISTGSYSKKKPTWWAILFYFADMLLITPLLSWVAIIWRIIGYIRRYIDKVPVPERIKEVNFKLSSIELPADKVKVCLNEIAAFYGYPDAGFRTLSDSEDDDPNLFVFGPALEEYDWNCEMKLNPPLKQFTITMQPPDPQTFTTL